VLTLTLAVLVLAMLVAPLAAEAQQAGKVPRIEVFLIPPEYFPPFEERLRQLGYVRGRNILFEKSRIEREYLTTRPEAQEAAEIASDLVRFNVDVIVTGPNPYIDAARQATTTVPIVMAYGFDPVGRGYIASLARPGGNITGGGLGPHARDIRKIRRVPDRAFASTVAHRWNR